MNILTELCTQLLIATGLSEDGDTPAKTNELVTKANLDGFLGGFAEQTWVCTADIYNAAVVLQKFVRCFAARKKVKSAVAAAKLSIFGVVGINGHTEFLLELSSTEISTYTRLRFSTVYNLDSALCKYNHQHHAYYNHLAPSFTMPIMPPKTWCKNPKNLDFLMRRQESLNIYLNKLLLNPTLKKSWPMRKFLEHLQSNA